MATVLAADINISAVGGTCNVQLPCEKADVHYKGAVAWIDVSGSTGGITVDPGAGDRIAGIIPYQQTTTAAGEMVEVIVSGLVWYPNTASLTVSSHEGMVGYDVSENISDGPADVVNITALTAAANDAILGNLLNISSTKGLLIHIGNGTGMIFKATTTFA